MKDFKELGAAVKAKALEETEDFGKSPAGTYTPSDAFIAAYEKHGGEALATELGYSTSYLKQIYGGSSLARPVIDLACKQLLEHEEACKLYIFRATQNDAVFVERALRGLGIKLQSIQ